MKVLGIVDWTNRDKGGNPIAGVLPLVEIQKSEWRQIDPVEEFPTKGQVFWPNAQEAVEGAFITFRAEANPGQRDQYRVVDFRNAFEVLDLRRTGTPTDVRVVLADGIWLPRLAGRRALVWCKPDVVVGPIDLTRGAASTVKLSGTNLARVRTFTGIQPQTVIVSGHERLVRIDDSAPSGYVDWDDDAILVRRALEAAVRVAKQAGRDSGQTKKQIDDAARALAAQGLGADAQLDRYRLERAVSLCADTEVVATLAPTLVEVLHEHPATKAALEGLIMKARADVEQTARAEIYQTLAREHAALQEATGALERKLSEVVAAERELLRLKSELDGLQRKAETASKDAEAAIDARILAVLDRPMELLAEVSVLRPLLGGRSSTYVDAPPERATSLDWSRPRGDSIKDRAVLQRALTSAARARGIEPSVMMQLHAALSARLMPVTLGPAALAVLVAYAHAACGGRFLVLHISPAVVQPRDLNDAPGGGLVAATEAARVIDGISMVVLEGANRAPLEAAVVPLLQLSDLALAGFAAAPNLRLAASLVIGATTVPVSCQLWNHAVAISPEPVSAAPQIVSVASDMLLSSDFLTPGDVPTAQVEELVDAWPGCAELRPTLERFGAALSRFYEGARITEALLHGLVLPYLVTAFSPEEQDDVVNKFGSADNDALSVAARRLRRRLC